MGLLYNSINDKNGHFLKLYLRFQNVSGKEFDKKIFSNLSKQKDGYMRKKIEFRKNMVHKQNPKGSKN